MIASTIVMGITIFVGIVGMWYLFKRINKDAVAGGFNQR